MSAEQTPLFSRVARSALDRSVTQLRVAGTEASLEDQLERMVARYMELKEQVREYHELRKELKNLMADESVMKAGQFTLHANTLNVNEKTVRSYSAMRLSVK